MTYYSPIRFQIINNSCFGQNRLQFEGIKESGSKNGVRFHNKIVAFFLGIFNKIVTIKDADGKIFQLNKGSLIGWLQKHGKEYHGEHIRNIPGYLRDIGKEQSPKDIQRIAEVRNRIDELKRHKKQRDERPLVNGHKNWSQSDHEIEQELAKLHKELGETCSKNSSKKWTSSIAMIDGILIPHSEEAYKITLWDLREMTPEKRKEAAHKFQLSKDFEGLGGEEAFFQKLEAADKDVLESLNIQDLKLNIQTSIMKYVFMTNDEFLQLSLDQVKGLEHAIQKVILQRLKSFKTVDVTDCNSDDLEHYNLVKFYNLNSDRINSILDKIPPHAYHYIKDENLKKIDWKKITDDRAKCVLAIFSENSSLLEDNHNFAQIPSEFLNLQLDKLTEANLRLLSEMQIRNLSIPSEYSDETVKRILSGLFSGTHEANLRRFACLPIAIVNTNLHRFTEHQLRLLSDEQLQKIEISKDYKEENVKAIFNGLFSSSHEANLKQFACLPITIVNANLHRFTEHQLQLLSDEHLQKLEISKDYKEEIVKAIFNGLFISSYKENVRRFAQFPNEFVNHYLDIFTEAQLSLLSDKQIKGLTKLSVTQLKTIFNGVDQNILKARFALLGIGLLKVYVENGNTDCLHLISVEQFKSLDFTTINDKQLALMLPSWDKEKIRAKFKGSGSYTHVSNNKVIKSETWIGLPDPALEDLSKKYKAANLEKLKTLTSEQKALIFNKLSDDNKGLINNSQ